MLPGRLPSTSSAWRSSRLSAPTWLERLAQQRLLSLQEGEQGTKKLKRAFPNALSLLKKTCPSCLENSVNFSTYHNLGQRGCVRTRLWAKRHLALTGPGGKHKLSAMRQGGPTLRPQWSHGSSSLPPIPRRPAHVLS